MGCLVDWQTEHNMNRNKNENIHPTGLNGDKKARLYRGYTVTMQCTSFHLSSYLYWPISSDVIIRQILIAPFWLAISLCVFIYSRVWRACKGSIHQEVEFVELSTSSLRHVDPMMEDYTCRFYKRLPYIDLVYLSLVIFFLQGSFKCTFEYAAQGGTNEVKK